MPLEQNQNHVINYFYTFTRRNCNLLAYDAMSIGIFRRSSLCPFACSVYS